MIGSTILHYKVLAQIGRGGMGEVWVAEDTKLGRKVALKLLRDAYTEGRLTLEEFQELMTALTISMMILLPALLASGWLSDRFGRKPVLMGSTLLAVIVALPLFWVMYHPSATLILLGQMSFGLIIGLYGGTQATTMVESAPSRIRCTAVALGYNTCLAIFGGLTPLVATWLVARTADELAPAYLIMAAAAVSFFAAWGIKETYRMPLA
jgi:MHS family proline/betaine transporter-like MFS transporter